MRRNSNQNIFKQNQHFTRYINIYLTSISSLNKNIGFHFVWLLSVYQFVHKTMLSGVICIGEMCECCSYSSESCLICMRTDSIHSIYFLDCFIGNHIVFTIHVVDLSVFITCIKNVLTIFFYSNQLNTIISYFQIENKIIDIKIKNFI